MTAALNGVTTRDAIGDACLPLICDAFGANVGALYLLDEAGTALEQLRVIGVSADQARRAERMPLDAHLPLTEAARIRAPVFVDSRDDFERRFGPARPPLDAEGRAVAPLTLGDRVLGVLGLAFSASRRIADADRALFLAVADQCAHAVERARLLERERQALADVTREMGFNEMFVGVLSHDLRNPLSSIVMAAKLLERMAIESELHRELVGDIVIAADRMMRMVRQLLDVTRSRLGGGIQIQRRPCDLASLVRSVTKEIQLANPDRAFVLDGAASVPGAWDDDALAQVVSNLVANAATYASPGTTVSVTVTGSTEAASVRVHNVGPTIPAHVLPTIFDPYVRGRHELESRGLGLGLYISDQIARAHGGRIDVQSTEAGGTTFTLTLPR